MRNPQIFPMMEVFSPGNADIYRLLLNWPQLKKKPPEPSEAAIGRSFVHYSEPEPPAAFSLSLSLSLLGAQRITE